MPPKECTGCGRTKPLEAFHRQADHKDGRASQCKLCICAKKKDRADADPDLRDHNAAYSRAYDKAMRGLRGAFPAEFKKLLAEARRREGI